MWHVHPDGMPYFFKEYPLCNVVTQDDVMDATIRRDLELNITSLFSQLQLPNPDHDYELWLTLDEKDHEYFDHIFMDHTAKEVFCYPSSGESKDSMKFLSLLSINLIRSVVKEGECSYWKYFSKAPMHHTLPDGVEDEMLLHLIQFSGGV